MKLMSRSAYLSNSLIFMKGDIVKLSSVYLGKCVILCHEHTIDATDTWDNSNSERNCYCQVMSFIKRI